MKHHSSDKRSETLSGANSRSPTQPALWGARSARDANKTRSVPPRAAAHALTGWAWLGSVKCWGGEMSRVKGKGSRQGTVVRDFASVSRVGE